MSEGASEQVAIIGLGRMGRAMAERLVAAGFPLRVWNRTADRAAGLAGATLCATPAEAATGSTIVLSSLADDRAVTEVVLSGEGRLIAALAPGAIHVGLSTISHDLARQLVVAHAAAGVGYVGAPVLGRPDAAARGELFVLAGGDPDAIARCRPVFDVIGKGVIPLGDAARASLAKLVVNLTIGGTIELLAESLALAEKGGIPPGDMFHLLADTLFGSPIVRGYGARIAAQEYEPAGFAIELGLKDVHLALGAAASLRVPLPIAGVVRDHLLATLARGHEQWDWTGLADAVRRGAGII